MEINKLILNILSKQRAKDSRNTLETKKKKKKVEKIHNANIKTYCKGKAIKALWHWH